MAKTDKHPKFDMRIDTDLYRWLKGYSRRKQKPMATLIKEYLIELRHQDLRATSQQVERSERTIYRNERNDIPRRGGIE